MAVSNPFLKIAHDFNIDVSHTYNLADLHKRVLRAPRDGTQDYQTYWHRQAFDYFSRLERQEARRVIEAMVAYIDLQADKLRPYIAPYV